MLPGDHRRASGGERLIDGLFDMGRAGDTAREALRSERAHLLGQHRRKPSRLARRVLRHRNGDADDHGEREERHQRRRRPISYARSQSMAQRCGQVREDDGQDEQPDQVIKANGRPHGDDHEEDKTDHRHQVDHVFARDRAAGAGLHGSWPFADRRAPTHVESSSVSVRGPGAFVG